MGRDQISARSGSVVDFRPRAGRSRPPASGPPVPPATPGRSPVEDTGKYERLGSDPDDYRHRMLVNAAAFLFCAALVAIGIWLAIRIADLRRDQDCVLAGRRNCAHISVTGSPAP